MSEMDDRLFQEESTYLPTVDGRKSVDLGPLELSLGGQLLDARVAYQTWGTLNAEASNAVVVCHAISGDSNAIAWWDRVVGPGRVLDPDRWFVICSNALGGCQGSTGPQSTAPDGNPYGSRFPAITVEDMVTVQQRLMQGFGIERPALVCGGSMGGMQALEWARRNGTERAWLTASAAQHSAMQIAFNEVARQAIMSDPGWCDGDYAVDAGPEAGLAVARMVGHLSYLSNDAFEQKFGRRRQGDSADVFQVESYLRYQGKKFTQRFDANSLLVLSRAIDRYACESLAGSECQLLVTAFISDWLYTPAQSEGVKRMADRDGIRCRYELIDLPFGHDAFLLDDRIQTGFVEEFLGN